MAQDKLSRHEELRYEYLLRNLEYLNPQQKEEFGYLYHKKQMIMREMSSGYPSSANKEPNYERYDDYGDYYEYYDYYDDDYDDNYDNQSHLTRICQNNPQAKKFTVLQKRKEKVKKANFLFRLLRRNRTRRT